MCLFISLMPNTSKILCQPDLVDNFLSMYRSPTRHVFVSMMVHPNFDEVNVKLLKYNSPENGSIFL